VVTSPAAKTPGSEVSPRVDLDLAARREGDRSLEPFAVGQQADLDKDPFEVDAQRSAAGTDRCRPGR
jgi:hypothetical protein